MIAKTTVLETNDPDRPTITLTLGANVLSNPDGSPLDGISIRQGRHVGPLFVGPDVQWGDTVSPGQSSKTEFNITAEKDSVKILRVEGGGERFVTKLETLEAGKSYRLVIETAAAQEPGNYVETVRVITDNAMLPYFPIKLRLRVKPPRS